LYPVDSGDWIEKPNLQCWFVSNIAVLFPVLNIYIKIDQLPLKA